MRTITVEAPKAKAKFGIDRKVTITRDFGANLAEAVAKFGETVVFDIFSQQATVKCQAVVRAHLEAADEAGKPKYTDAQAIEAGMNYAPNAGAVRTPKDPLSDMLKAIESGKLSKEDVIKAIKERAGK